MAYHFIALLFYFGAFLLEAATTAANGEAFQPQINTTDIILCITNPQGNIFTILDNRQYNINVAATVSIHDRLVILYTGALWIFIHIIVQQSQRYKQDKNM